MGDHHPKELRRYRSVITALVILLLAISGVWLFARRHPPFETPPGGSATLVIVYNHRNDPAVYTEVSPSEDLHYMLIDATEKALSLSYPGPSSHLPLELDSAKQTPRRFEILYPTSQQLVIRGSFIQFNKVLVSLSHMNDKPSPYIDLYYGVDGYTSFVQTNDSTIISRLRIAFPLQLH